MTPQRGVGYPFREQLLQCCCGSTIWRLAAPIRVEELKLRRCARRLPTVKRPHRDILAPSTSTAKIPAAGYSNYAKNRSQATSPAILDALFAPALKAVPVSGLQCLNLLMNNASLHLAEHGFTFFQGETDLFSPDSCGFSFHLCHYLSIQNAACEAHLDPNSKFH
jgi:hypothetical protein